MRMIGGITAVIIFLLMMWESWSCKDSVTGVSPIVFPPSNISYGKYVQPLFNQQCSIPSCHTQESKADAGNLSLETWSDAVTAVPAVIIPGDSANSPLVWSIEQTHGLPRMPPLNRPPLTQNQINGLKQWIQEGAKNN
jgi:hypothetical protein